MLTPLLKTFAVPSLNRRRCCILFNLLKVLDDVVEGRPERVRAHLLKFRSATLFTRAATVPCPAIVLLTLRLIKCQARFLGTPWRKGNVGVISAVYRYVGAEVTVGQCAVSGGHTFPAPLA